MASFVFVSGNLKKVEYLEGFLGRKVRHHALDLVEIQSLDPLEVVEHKAREAYKHLEQPVLIEDTAVIFKAFGKLPGPFIKFFLSEVGNAGMCRMLDVFEDRRAIASVVYGLYNGREMHTFEAEVTGSIGREPVEGRGMGWDPIFIPDGQQKTYSQMTEEEYAHYSVRNKAVKKLQEFIR